MKPKRKNTNDTWERMCTSKLRFSDEWSCRVEARDSLRTNTGQRFLWVYRCPGCRGWHMTSMPNDHEAVSASELYYDPYR